MNMVVNILFSILTLAAILGSLWYVPHRAAVLMGFAKKRLLVIGYMIGMLLGMIAMGNNSHSSNQFTDSLLVVTGLLFGLHIFLTFSYLILHGIRLLIPISKSIMLWLGTGVAFFLFLIGAIQANFFQVVEVVIPIKGLEKEVTMMHIPDVHLGAHRGKAYLEKIVNKTNSYQPDMVLFNGDFVDGNSALKGDTFTPLLQLKAPAFFTTGNHEDYVKTQEVLEKIRTHKVRILRNEMVELNGIQLIGLDYMNADEHTYDMHAVNKMTIKEELPKISADKEKPIVLMHHSPVGLDYVMDYGVDLMVAGHTHAGQVWPGTMITPFLFPLNKGYYKRGDSQFFVSQGAGTYGPRMRLGSQNEINLITLTRAKDKK